MRFLRLLAPSASLLPVASRYFSTTYPCHQNSSSGSSTEGPPGPASGKATRVAPGAAFASECQPPRHPAEDSSSLATAECLRREEKGEEGGPRAPPLRTGLRKRISTVPLRSASAAAASGRQGSGSSENGSASSRGDAEAGKEARGRSGKAGVVAVQQGSPQGLKTLARPQDGPMVPDYGPLRPTGLWTVDEVLDDAKKTVDFRRIDDVESEMVEDLKRPEEALVPFEEEERWKHKLMFLHKFKKTPKHLTWKELGEEIECVDCAIELDEHRPEELFTITFYFTDKTTGVRDVVWSARNDVSYSEGFTDLLAAIGACLGRSDVHRTIRFDDGVGSTRDIAFRKRSRYTSDMYVAFRPPERYQKFQRKEEQDEYETAMESEGMSTWGYHPSLMDAEFSELDFKDPEGTYEVAISAHGFSFVVLRAIHRLLSRPMKEFYRPSQLMRTAKVRTEDEVGFAHAMKGWLGIDEQIFPHYTPIEALQDHWLGKDAPFSLCAIVNKLRELNYLKKENPEYQSWLSVRHRDTHLAIRNMGVKMLGVGASTLFVPVSHNATVNRLLPKPQQRRLESRFSLNALMGLPDETRKIGEFKKITGHSRTSELPETSADKKEKDA